jgi:Rps23 Pro-64 3,4-dihydroxylase Tpa1-like proline 4-hydroxylase
MARKSDKDKNKDKDKELKKPKVNPELEGFDIRVDSFGEIKSNLSIDKINEFLNRAVDDKKLRDREDLDFIRDKKKPGKPASSKRKPAEEDEDDA